MSDVIIFEQDGNVYAALSHTMGAKELAKDTAEEIRYMPKVPRAKMRVVSIEEFRTLLWAKPTFR